MKDLMGMMKQVGEMQARVQQMQDELAGLEIDGQSGGGLVKVTLTGKGDLKKSSHRSEPGKAGGGRDPRGSDCRRRGGRQRQARRQAADQDEEWPAAAAAAGSRSYSRWRAMVLKITSPAFADGAAIPREVHLPGRGSVAPAELLRRAARCQEPRAHRR